MHRSAAFQLTSLGLKPSRFLAPVPPKKPHGARVGCRNTANTPLTAHDVRLNVALSQKKKKHETRHDDKKKRSYALRRTKKKRTAKTEGSGKSAEQESLHTITSSCKQSKYTHLHLGVRSRPCVSPNTATQQRQATRLGHLHLACLAGKPRCTTAIRVKEFQQTKT